MPLRHPVTDADHVQGHPAATIELIEYGDYQCPHCGRAYPIIKELQQCLGERLRFIFRNFPLSEIHPQAKDAALAAEAAARQGKYWQMHDVLFENQRRLHKTALKEYARSLQLDLNQFEQDLQNPGYKEKIESEFYGGMRSGVNATPTFFINGEKYEGNWEEGGLMHFIKVRYAH